MGRETDSTVCGKIKMEPEKRRASREQGVRGDLSHTLTHGHTHRGCSMRADRKKIQRNCLPEFEQRI